MQKDDVMNDQEFKLTLDCDNLTMSFFYNNEQLGNSIKIEPKDNYYAAISYNIFGFGSIERRCVLNEGSLAIYQLVLHTVSIT